MIDDDDLTIDGVDLLGQIREGIQAQEPIDPGFTPGHDDDRTLTDRGPAGGRWAPTASPGPRDQTALTEPPSARRSGLSRLQVGVVLCTFALGALLGLVIGLRQGGDGQPEGARPAVSTLASTPTTTLATTPTTEVGE